MKHVIFIGIDGAQYNSLLALNQPGGAQGILQMDHLESFTGGLIGTSSQQTTFSGPGWSTLLTGVWTDRHGVTINNGRPVNAAVDSIFERVNASSPEATVASIVHWDDINLGHFSRETGRLGDPTVVDYQAANLPDEEVVSTVKGLIANQAPTFTFMHLDEPDHVGHSVGYGVAYNQSLITVAGQVNEILVSVAEREAANPDEDWMVIVSTDHGRDAGGFNHGGQSASERQTFIAPTRTLSRSGRRRPPPRWPRPSSTSSIFPSPQAASPGLPSWPPTARWTRRRHTCWPPTRPTTSRRFRSMPISG